MSIPLPPPLLLLFPTFPTDPTPPPPPLFKPLVLPNLHPRLSPLLRDEISPPSALTTPAPFPPVIDGNAVTDDVIDDEAACNDIELVAPDIDFLETDGFEDNGAGAGAGGDDESVVVAAGIVFEVLGFGDGIGDVEFEFEFDFEFDAVLGRVIVNFPSFVCEVVAVCVRSDSVGCGIDGIDDVGAVGKFDSLRAWF
ncbi:hypothetical protein HDU76_004198 [Blyttiomyces sp. JEL0837]|nr:hypothetical protein HDU76_004198 [Blyttiomyces sp. JEL0837]